MDLYPALQDIAYFLATILVTWISAEIIRVIIGRLLVRGMPRLAAEARRAGYLTIWVIGIIIAVEGIGVPIDILLVFVALFGIAVIVAFWEPFANLGAKYFADIYVPYKVGDSISILQHTGRVIEVNPIATILLAEDESLVSIPNSAFMRQTMVNKTPHAWKEVAIPISVSNLVDLPAFESAILKSCTKLRLHLDERFPPVVAVRSRNAQTTDLVLTVMIRDPEEREAIVTEIKERISATMRKATAAKKSRSAA